jgi:hypothetical protein
MEKKYSLSKKSLIVASILIAVFFLINVLICSKGGFGCGIFMSFLILAMLILFILYLSGNILFAKKKPFASKIKNLIILVVALIAGFVIVILIELISYLIR